MLSRVALFGRSVSDSAAWGMLKEGCIGQDKAAAPEGFWLSWLLVYAFRPAFLKKRNAFVSTSECLKVVHAVHGAA